MKKTIPLVRSSAPRSRLRVAAFATPKRTTPRPNPGGNQTTTPRFSPRYKVLVGCFAIATSCAVYSLPQVHAEAPPAKKIRLSEVKKHGKDAEQRWVIKGTRVYDITEWIPGHPGGEVILRAVGGCIDKYWDIFSIHKKPEVYDILEEYFIGELDPQDLVDGKVPQDDVDDPFDKDPKRDERLLVHSERPCNAESPKQALNNFLTPNGTFYVRNHLWVPDRGEEAFTLHLELHDGEERDYTLNDLKTKFEQVEVTATLQCSGNRRKHMTDAVRSASGLQWDVGGISNGHWKGVRLRDVLADAGFPVDAYPADEVKHAQFMGAEAYGASIPIEKAVAPRGDVLLVYELNGQPLPRDHGFPLRVLVPGHVAARSVKWVHKITLSTEESPSQWQQRDYKCFGPNQDSASVDWSTAPAIQETPVQSAITSLKKISAPSRDDANLVAAYGLEQSVVEVEGYAFSGGGRAIVRVDVSPDDGRTWVQADLLPDDAVGARAWAWKRWRSVVPQRLVGRVFVVKAVDEAYNTQPDGYDAHYNFRGNLTTGWHRVGIEHLDAEKS